MIRLSRCSMPGLMIAMSYGAIFCHADDPVPQMTNLYRAPDAVLIIYSVQANQEAAFQNVLVESGPFDALTAGVANQRLLSPLPTGKKGETFYFSINRYYGQQIAKAVESQRAAAIGQFVSRGPTEFSLTLVEHILGDWGWEKNAESSTRRVKAFENPEIFERKLGTLSFFKIGLTGHIGHAEIFSNGTELNEVRRVVNVRRAGLTGASIFKTSTGRFVVYSEFFQAPQQIAGATFGEALTSDDARGAQAGIVVQNYVPR